MKHWRTIAGILVIGLALAGLFFWELRGREAVLTAPFLVARSTIASGQIVKATDFAVIGLTDKTRMQGALTPDQIKEIVGLSASRTLPANSQICREDFLMDALYLKPGQSIYTLRPEWIGMLSSSLRRGDRIELVSRTDGLSLGVFGVAFVKDSQGAEVVDSSPNGEARQTAAAALDRTASTGLIDHVEIISDRDAFNRILEAVNGSADGNLLLVQVPAGESATGKMPAGETAAGHGKETGL